MSSSLNALLLGTLIPLVSSIIPVLTAMQMNMTDSLDVHKSKTKALYVKILQSNKKDLTGIIIVGLVNLIYGFGGYYLVPFCLVAFKFSLFSNLMLLGNGGIMLGLSFLSNVFAPFINVFLIRIFTVFEKQSTR